jgi:hypothetical protein
MKTRYNVAVWATGMRAVNAIPWVCDAEPGIVDALHIRSPRRWARCIRTGMACLPSSSAGARV